MSRHYSFSAVLTPLLFIAGFSAGADEHYLASVATKSYVDGQVMPAFIKEQGIVPLTAENVQQHIAKVIGEEPTGFASLIARYVYPGEEPTVETDKCAVARQQREQWYADHGRPVPTDGFGKIVKWKVEKHGKGEKIYWTGELDLCSWFGSGKTAAEFYFEIELTGEGMRQLHRNDDTEPFPGVALPPGGLMTSMNGFRYKLQADGDVMDIQVATKNGQSIGASDPLFSSPDDNCIDIFFIDPPTGTLPDQLGYCMGRCDFRLINTGR